MDRELFSQDASVSWEELLSETTRRLVSETTRRLEVDNAEAAAKRPGGVEIEKDAGFSDFNRQREREATQRDVQKLKDSIQVRTAIFFSW